MLESEAKKKWCPHVRLADCERGFGYNRWDAPAAFAKTTNNGNCIGSACMMWVETDKEPIQPKQCAVSDGIPIQEYGNAGHCGLIKS